MSELPSREVYKLINEFESQPEFTEFVRSCLNLRDREINDITADFSGIREQKYQMISYWKRKVGRAGTINELRRLKEQYDAERNPAKGDRRPTSAPVQREQGIVGPRREEPPRDLVGQQEGREEGILNERSFNEANLSQRSVPTAVDMPATIARMQARNPAEEDRRPASVPDQQEQDIVEPRRQEPPRDLVGQQEGHVEGILNERSFNEANLSQRSVPTAVDMPATIARMQAMEVRSDEDHCSDLEGLKVRPCTEEEIKAILTKGGSYPVKSSPKGHLIIINNTPADMIGCSGKDVANMENLWTQLDCKVIKKKDLSAQEVEDVLKKVRTSHRIHSSDFLVIFIMAKSEMVTEREAFIAADNNPVFFHKIVEDFNNSNFGAFAGKPKLFFCHLLSSGEGDEVGVFKDELMVLSRAIRFGSTPICANGGSWFINAIANIFSKFSQRETVQKMLQKVGQAVESKVLSAAEGESMCSETAIAIHSGLDTLYLLPGHPKDDLFDD